MGKPDHGDWPAILDTPGDPALACFTEVQLPVPADPADAAALDGFRVFRIACPDAASLVPDVPAARPSP